MKPFVIAASLGLALGFSTWAQGPSSGAAHKPTQPSGPTDAVGKTLELPSGTPIFGTLETKLYAEHYKLGDRVEALITKDVTVSHQTVLKKGARAIGSIVKLQTEPPAGGQYGVGIAFETVAFKNGETLLLRMEIQAIAPPSATGVDPITDLPYEGSSHISSDIGSVEALKAKARGAVGLQGVTVGSQVINATYISILVCKDSNIHLEKWSQVVFRVVNP